MEAQANTAVSRPAFDPADVTAGFFFMFLMIPVLMTFTDILCNLRITTVTKIYSVFCGFLAMSQLIFPYPYGSDTLALWQVTGIPAMVWILANNILLPFVREIKSGKKLGAVMMHTYPGNLLIGIIVFVFTIIIDLVDALVLHYSTGFTRYSMCAFVLAVAFMLARLYGKMGRELAEKSALLENAGNPAAAREAVFKEHNLTEREREVARLMAEGLDNETIAGRLFVSTATVAFHVKNIYRKFGIEGKNRERAAFVARVLR